MPTVEETLRNQPFFGALPVPVQGLLLDVAKENMQLRSNVLYKEDMKPDGIWLIANGVVKVVFHAVQFLGFSVTYSNILELRLCA